MRLTWRLFPSVVEKNKQPILLCCRENYWSCGLTVEEIAQATHEMQRRCLGLTELKPQVIVVEGKDDTANLQTVLPS